MNIIEDLSQLYYELQAENNYKLNNDGEIIGYIVPEFYEEDARTFIYESVSSHNKNPNVLNSCYEDIKNLPIYTEKQWEIYDVLESFATSRVIDEEWVTLGVGQNHFKYHCLGGGDDYSSKDDDVYYDFKTQEEFDKFEDEVSKKALSPDVIIDSLAEPNVWDTLVNNLKDGKTVMFSQSCGFKGKIGSVSYVFVPGATDHTTNYGSNPTVNFIILTPDNKTISLYPMALSYIPVRMPRMANKNKSELPINVQRLNAFNEMKTKLADIHFDDIVKKYMRTGPYDYPGEVLFFNKYFFVNSHAYPYKPKNAEEDVEPINATVFTIKAKDNREVGSGRLYAHNEEEFRKNVEDALSTVETQLKDKNML